jgi:putative transposase
LLRGVATEHPNHVWGIDITYIRLQHGWLYLLIFENRKSRNMS